PEAEAAAARARIRPSTETAAFADAQLVVEAATENVDLKGRIFEGLAKATSTDAILATNTSSISITALAARTDRPHRVIGMHFMNPVPVMKLVEVIRGLATDDATYDATAALAARMGKTVVTSADMPGFVVNRILMPYVNEAIFAVHEGVAS